MNTAQPCTSTTKFECYLQQSPAALERFLRTVRVRGFEVEQMQLEPAGSHWQLSMAIRGSRCTLNLMAQLEKLVEVQQAILLPNAATGTSRKTA